MTFSYRLRTAVLICALPLLTLAADGDNSIRRPSIGFRIESFPERLFETTSLATSTTSPIADYNYYGSSASHKAAVGPTVEYRLRSHISLGVEFRVHEVRYTQQTQIRSGKKDPNASTDDRKVTTITENTRSNYWEFPILAHYCGFKPKGLFAKAYVSGGMELRHVGQIRTGTEYSYADGTTDYKEIAAKPARNNQVGFVIGAGLRLVDDFNIKVTPEVRYIVWQGNTFQGLSYRSVANQYEAGIGFSF